MHLCNRPSRAALRLSFPAPSRAWFGAGGRGWGVPTLPPIPSVLSLCPSPPLGLTVADGHDQNEPLQAMGPFSGPQTSPS